MEVRQIILEIIKRKDIKEELIFLHFRWYLCAHELCPHESN